MEIKSWEMPMVVSQNLLGYTLVEHPFLWYNKIRARTEVPARTC